MSGWSRTWTCRSEPVPGIDIETCSACGGALRILASVVGQAVIQTIIDHLKRKDETCEPLPLPESRVPSGALFG
jgi:hypothetical protein